MTKIKNMVSLFALAALLLMGFMFTPSSVSATSQSQCTSSDGNWIAADGGTCVCPSGSVDGGNGCVPSSGARYFGDELADLASDACSNNDPGQRTACKNNILDNGATQAQVETYCNGTRTSYPARTACMNSFNSSSGQSPTSGGDPASNPGDPDPSGQSPSGPGVDSCAGGNCPDLADIPRDEGGFDTGQSTLGGIRDTDDCETELNGQECLQNLKIFELLNTILEFMVIITIPLITIVIVIGGVQYSVSTGDPGKVTAAKGRIMNGIIALASFIFLWSFLQWLIPGGAF